MDSKTPSSLTNLLIAHQHLRKDDTDAACRMLSTMLENGSAKDIAALIPSLLKGGNVEGYLEKQPKAQAIPQENNQVGKQQNRVASMPVLSMTDAGSVNSSRVVQRRPKISTANSADTKKAASPALAANQTLPSRKPFLPNNVPKANKCLQISAYAAAITAEHARQKVIKTIIFNPATARKAAEVPASGTQNPAASNASTTIPPPAAAAASTLPAPHSVPNTTQPPSLTAAPAPSSQVHLSDPTLPGLKVLMETSESPSRNVENVENEQDARKARWDAFGLLLEELVQTSGARLLDLEEDVSFSDS